MRKKYIIYSVMSVLVVFVLASMIEIKMRGTSQENVQQLYSVSKDMDEGELPGKTRISDYENETIHILSAEDGTGSNVYGIVRDSDIENEIADIGDIGSAEFDEAAGSDQEISADEAAAQEETTEGMTTEEEDSESLPEQDVPQPAESEPEEIEQPEEEKPSLYSHIAISNAKSYVNIRKEPNTDSPVLGKLHRDSAAEILDKQGEWYYVESGSVKGYISEKYLLTGLSDEELLRKYSTQKIRVQVDGLNVREKPDTESKKKTVIYKNEIYSVLELEGEWAKVNIPDDNVTGYIKLEFAELIAEFPRAVSREEEKELERQKKEEQAKKETEIKKRDSVSYSEEELKLLACLVHAEAGNQSYEGKLAVANVVLNRVRSSKYANTIKGVIYQPGQFTVAASGSLAKQLSNYDRYTSNSQRLSVKAAKAALEGENNIGSRLYFNGYKAAVKQGFDKLKNAVKLQDHLFW